VDADEVTIQSCQGLAMNAFLTGYVSILIGVLVARRQSFDQFQRILWKTRSTDTWTMRLSIPLLTAPVPFNRVTVGLFTSISAWRNALLSSSK